MSKNNIKTSGFSLAKRKELTGDDFYEIKQFEDMEALLQNAPEKEENMFKTPKVIQ